MAEDAIPSDADPRPRKSATRLPSLAQLYAAQRLGYPVQAKSYTLPELYALERTGAPLDLAGVSVPESNAPPSPQTQSLPILVDQGGAPLQPEPLTPAERLGGAVRAAGQGALGDVWNYGEALARTGLGLAPKSTQALGEANAALGKVGKVPSEGDATFSDQLADIAAASQRFDNAYPAQATAAGLFGTGLPLLAGFGTTGLLARILSGERLPELAAPLAGRLGPKLAEGAAPATAAVASEAEPAVVPAAAKAESVGSPVSADGEPAVAANTVPRTEAVPETIPPRTQPDGRYYSVAHETMLKEKPTGTGRKRHIREANENLLNEMENDPELASMMSKLGVNLAGC